MQQPARSHPERETERERNREKQSDRATERGEKWSQGKYGMGLWRIQGRVQEGTFQSQWEFGNFARRFCLSHVTRLTR